MAEVVTEVDHPEFEMNYTKPDDSGEFVMVILEEDTPTIDGRRFKPGSVEWRDLPIPLMYKTTNDGPGAGHKGSQVGGAITDIWRDGSLIYGAGHFSSNDEGQKLRELIAEGALSGVSADVGGANVELEADAEGKEYRSITQGKIMMVTCLPGQAFDDSRISVTADGGPVDPPTEWFSNPNLTEPTALTVTEDGRIFGHAFTWGACHIGMRDRCLTPPRSKSGYRWFAVGQTMTFGNEPVNTGVLTLDTDHAGITLNAEQSKKHYDHTGVQVADIAMGEDAIGGWFSGALRCNLSQDQIRTIRASAVSGDWRQIGGSLELVGLLVVNTAGFPVPRANVKNNEALALVASGVVTPCGCGECEEAAANDLRMLDLAVLDSIVFVNHNHTSGRGHANGAGDASDHGYKFNGIKSVASAHNERITGRPTKANARARYAANAKDNAVRMTKALADKHTGPGPIVRDRGAARSELKRWYADNRKTSSYPMPGLAVEESEEFVNHNHTPGRGHPNAGGERTIKLADGKVIKHAVDTKSYVNDPIRPSHTDPKTGTKYPLYRKGFEHTQAGLERGGPPTKSPAADLRMGYGSLRRVRNRTYEDDPLRGTNEDDPWGVGPMPKATHTKTRASSSAPEAISKAAGLKAAIAARKFDQSRYARGKDPTSKSVLRSEARKEVAALRAKNSPEGIAAEQHAEKLAYNILNSSPGTQSRENVVEATKFFGERGKLTTPWLKASEAHHKALTKATRGTKYMDAQEWAAKQRIKKQSAADKIRMSQPQGSWDAG